MHHLEPKNTDPFLNEEQNESDDIPLHLLSKSQILEGFKTLIFAVLPNISCVISTAIVSNTNMYFIGHLNRPVLLAAIGLGQTWANAFAIAIFLSLNGGFVTLAAQAFGAGKFRDLGIYYQKCLFLYSLLLIPLGFFLIFSNSLMSALGIEEEVSDLAGEFLRWSMPAFVAQMFYDCTKNLLIAQNIFYYQAAIQGFTCVLNILWCKIFIVYCDLDVIGVAISRGLTEIINAALIILVINKFELSKESWFPWTKEAQINLHKFFKDISTIGSSIYLEWIAFESTIIFVGLLKDNVVLAAHATTFNYTFFYYMFPTGLSIAMITYIGNSVGEGKRYKAQKFAVIGAVIGFILSLSGTILATFYSDEIALFFTPEPEVSSTLSRIIFYYGCCTFADTFISVLTNILKPVNKQKIVMRCFIITYYGLGVPMSYILGIICGYGIDGIWFGMGFEIHLMACLMIWQLWKLDWKKEVNAIQADLNGKKMPSEENFENVELEVIKHNRN